jgi:DNA-binding winged helix-turn-helix (wHTH) protein
MSLLFGDFAYDQERRQLLRAGHPVRIEPKAYELLGLLLERRPRALSKAQIRDVLWPGTFVSESALARLITDLRATLEDDVRQPRFIRTVHGFGYAFCGQALLATEQQRIETAGSETVARSPYPGLSSFMEADASRFFGREGEVQALLEKIRRQKLLAVIGPSGVGKTSFMRAGVVASLPSEWGALVVTPGERPVAALAQAVSRELAGDADALAELIQGIAEQGHDLKRVLTAVSCWRKKHGEALLVVDQFEELFAQNPQEVQARFASLLGAIAAEADVHVVVSIRDDFLFRCSEHESLLPLFDALTPLRLPSKDALVRAVMEPAAKEGLGFEDEALVEEMVQAVVTERGALPLLAFAVSRLWEERDRERKLLTRAAYREIGGVEGALAQHAEATLEIIGPGREGIVREVFRNLSTSQGTRAVLGHEELLSAFADRAAAEVVLRQLVGARLLTSYETESGDGIPSRHAVEIVHESLLRAWPRLVRWQTQDADGAQFRDQLRQTARLWGERGRAEDLLWTGASHLDYRAWRARYPGGLSSVEEAFAHAMAALADRRRRRRRIAITAAFAMLAIGLGVLGTLWRRSETSRRTAAAEALRAEAAKLLALGRLQLDEYPTAALAYATKSLELADNQEARRFAVEALWRGPTAFILQPVPSGQWRMVAFSPDGKWLAASSFDAEVVVWPSSGGEPLVLGDHERAGAYRRLAFGPHSDLLVTKSEAADPLRIWSIPQGQLLRKMEFEEHTAFLLRGDRLLTFTSSPPAGSSLVGRTAGWRSWPLREGPGEDLGRVPQTSVTDPDVDPDAKWVAMARRRSVVIRPLERLRLARSGSSACIPGTSQESPSARTAGLFRAMTRGRSGSGRSTPTMRDRFESCRRRRPQSRKARGLTGRDPGPSQASRRSGWSECGT